MNGQGQYPKNIIGKTELFYVKGIKLLLRKKLQTVQ